MEFAVKMIFEVTSYASLLVIVVLGLAVIISMMGVFNIVHGEFVVLGAYTVYIMELWHFPIWLAILAAPFVVALFGARIQPTCCSYELSPRVTMSSGSSDLASSSSCCICRRKGSN